MTAKIHSDINDMEYAVEESNISFVALKGYATNGSQDKDLPFYYTYGDFQQEFTVFVYEAFEFERPIYLYIWEILVIVTFLVNILVISVLLQKQLQNVTNLILVAIAISDSMTGLVTLPTYILVYQTRYTNNKNQANMTEFPVDYEYYEPLYPENYDNFTFGYYQTGDLGASYNLSKSLCKAFMISKFFLSKSFHTISIWLTLYLGIQRYISVAYPFKFQVLFTTRNTIIVCVSFALLAPILHMYHLVNDKTENGFCAWQLKQGNVGDAVHLWMTLLLRHVIPCALLIITTILFVYHLNKNPFNGRNLKSTRVFSGKEVREDENRRVSNIVIAIMILFLIPEVPYAIFSLFTAIVRHTNANHLSDLKRNRAFHAGYEIILVLSFHLNFYIYTFFNKRFRRQLKKLFSDSRIYSFIVSSHKDSVESDVTRQKRLTDSQEMQVLNPDTNDKIEESSNFV